MDSRVCHALQCTDRAEPRRCFCDWHWAKLPPELQARVLTELAAIATKAERTSGSFATAVILAVRWLAVAEGLMKGPLPGV